MGLSNNAWKIRVNIKPPVSLEVRQRSGESPAWKHAKPNSSETKTWNHLQHLFGEFQFNYTELSHRVICCSWALDLPSSSSSSSCPRRPCPGCPCWSDWPRCWCWTCFPMNAAVLSAGLETMAEESLCLRLSRTDRWHGAKSLKSLQNVFLI